MRQSRAMRPRSTASLTLLLRARRKTTDLPEPHGMPTPRAGPGFRWRAYFGLCALFDGLRRCFFWFFLFGAIPWRRAQARSQGARLPSDGFASCDVLSGDGVSGSEARCVRSCVREFAALCRAAFFHRRNHRLLLFAAECVPLRIDLLSASGAFARCGSCRPGCISTWQRFYTGCFRRVSGLRGNGVCLNACRT